MGDVVPVAVAATLLPLQAVTVNEVASPSAGVNETYERPGPTVAATPVGAAGTSGVAWSAAATTVASLMTGATAGCRAAASSPAARSAAGPDRTAQVRVMRRRPRPEFDMPLTTAAVYLPLREVDGRVTQSGEGCPRSA